jgi:hypothetical protein
VGFEHPHVFPWSADWAVVIAWSSDHANQTSPDGPTDTFGKLRSRSVDAGAVLQGISWSVRV